MGILMVSVDPIRYKYRYNLASCFFASMAAARSIMSLVSVAASAR